MKKYCITTNDTVRIEAVKKTISFDFEFYFGAPVYDCVKYLGLNKKKAKHWRLRGLNKGEVACFHSHLSLWKMCYEANEPFFIFEDNIEMIREFDVDYAEKLAKYGLVSFAQKKNYKYVTPHYSKMFYTRAYVISPESAFKLYKYVIRNSPVFLPVDSLISLWFLTKVRGYCAPYPCFKRQCRTKAVSLIGNNESSKNLYSRFAFLRFGFITTRIYRILFRFLLDRHVI